MKKILFGILLLPVLVICSQVGAVTMLGHSDLVNGPRFRGAGDLLYAYLYCSSVRTI